MRSSVSFICAFVAHVTLRFAVTGTYRATEFPRHRLATVLRMGWWASGLYVGGRTTARTFRPLLFRANYL